MAAPVAAARAAKAARRLVPLALEAYRRWDRLTPQQKERYKQQARGYVQQARGAVDKARERRRAGGAHPGGRRPR